MFIAPATSTPSDSGVSETPVPAKVVTPPAISPADQQRLIAAYLQLQQVSQAVEMARLQFNAVLYQAMAEAKLSPSEYQAQWTNGSFVFTRIENAQGG